MNNLVFLKKGTNQNKNLFLIHAGNGEIQPYILFCSSFSPEINCWGLRADRFDDFSPKNRSISSMAKSYIKQIKKIQPEGPYLLAGWCFGGVRAFEIALQLESSGEKVDFLSIINSAPPIINDRKRIHMVNNYALLELSNDPKKKTRFNLETEKKLICKWLARANISSISDKLSNNEEYFWKNFVEIFNASKHQKDLMEIIKKDIPKDRAKAIPYFDSINFQNLIYYLNVMRTDANAQAFYVPTKKVKVKVDFFEANGSLVKRKNDWNLYLNQPIKTYLVKGDHFSIFNTGYMEEFARLFDEIMNRVVK